MTVPVPEVDPVTNPVTPPAAPPAPVVPATDPDGTADKDAEIERLRGEIRKFRKIEDEVKALRPKAKKFEDLQQAAMSAEERLQAQLDEASASRATAEKEAGDKARELAAYQSAVKYGISQEDMVFLEGVPADDLDKAAQKLAKRLGRADIPDFNGGPRTPAPATDSMGDFLRQQIDRARGRR